MTNEGDIFQDLASESRQIDAMVADLDPSKWTLPTPAPGWTISHQIAHLAFIYHLAGMAASDAGAFHAMVEPAKDDFQGAVTMALDIFMDEPATLLERWRTERDGAVKALAALSPDQTVPWLVRPLPAGILACAGIMEAFAHGQDIADTLGVEPERTDRLRHLAGFAVLVWDFGYQARGLNPPDTTFRFELTSPSGEPWNFGPADAPQKISGPAVDFCLLVTRRRHHADLTVTATGPDAEQWLEIAQAYRGPAGPGRRPGQFA